MKLSELAKKASALPSDLAFDWSGPEQFHADVFKREVTTLPDVIEYIDKLRSRMAEYAMGLHELQEAYKKLRDIILDAEIAPPSDHKP